MISLISEFTDGKGRRARAGWVFYDADCKFCVATVGRLAGVIEPLGYGLAPLQDARVRALLNLPEEQLLSEMKLLTPDGRQFGGADALIRLCRDVWWAWPLYALGYVPGVTPLLRAGYRWIAARRACISGRCPVGPGPNQVSQSSDVRR
jgi:predicted DCC family thiol-disulfide oxidoreductase YuxK